MALIPLLWLIALAFQGERRSVLWWGFAGTLACSWLADTAAHFVNPWYASAMYPVLQILLLGSLLLTARRWLLLVAGFSLATTLDIALWGLNHRELFLHTLAWFGMVALVWPHPSRFRTAVVMAFGIGWLGWIGYMLSPSWTTWGIYQSVRALSLGIFCWACAPHRVSVRLVAS